LLQLALGFLFLCFYFLLGGFLQLFAHPLRLLELFLGLLLGLFEQFVGLLFCFFPLSFQQHLLLQFRLLLLLNLLHILNLLLLCLHHLLHPPRLLLRLLLHPLHLLLRFFSIIFLLFLRLAGLFLQLLLLAIRGLQPLVHLLL
jgi:hypothetical protein